MDEIIYDALEKYYHALELKGYMSYGNMQKLLVLVFFWDFIFHDYDKQLTKEDYHLIERALDCLYGTTCLIPYPDYLKMGKLNLSKIARTPSTVIPDEPVDPTKPDDPSGNPDTPVNPTDDKTREILNTYVLKLLDPQESSDNPDSDILITIDE